MLILASGVLHGSCIEKDEAPSRALPLSLIVQRIVRAHPSINTNKTVDDDGTTRVGRGAGPHGSWMVLSGADNYYVPIFVEAVLAAVSAEDERGRATGGGAGLVYWDFVLDRKGNDKINQAMRAAAAAAADDDDEADELLWAGLSLEASKGARRLLLPVSVDSSGRVEHLRFDGADEGSWPGIALAFATEHGLDEGGGCEKGAPGGDGSGGPDGVFCVARLLTASMAAVAERAGTEAATGHAPQAWHYVLPGQYEGHVAAALANSKIDVGAFAFPTAVGRAVGYTGRHHSADWAFLQVRRQYLC